MSVEQNKQLIERFWHAMVQGDWTVLDAMLADEITWHIPGNLPVSGLKKGKAVLQQMYDSKARPAMEGQKVQTEIRAIHAEGDAAILEAGVRLGTPKGEYHQQYCLVLQLKAGKICNVREYMDTQRAKDFLFS